MHDKVSATFEQGGDQSVPVGSDNPADRQLQSLGEKLYQLDIRRRRSPLALETGQIIVMDEYPQCADPAHIGKIRIRGRRFLAGEAWAGWHGLLADGVKLVIRIGR